jgi:hypothetical protein
MTHVRTYRCEVCGNERQSGQWFLVSRDYEQKTLTILKWNTTIASRVEVCHVCSLHHAQLLVAHWMATGTLNFPCKRHSTFSYAFSQQQGFDPTDARGWLRLGELVVDPNSLAGLEKEPSLLMSVLDAIDVALHANWEEGKIEEEEAEDLRLKRRPAFDA